MKGRPKNGRRYIASTPKGLRAPKADRLLADLELVETAGLRAAIELRGFGEHHLADLLCEAIERVATIHEAAGKRLPDAVAGGELGELHE